MVPFFEIALAHAFSITESYQPNNYTANRLHRIEGRRPDSLFSFSLLTNHYMACYKNRNWFDTCSFSHYNLVSLEVYTEGSTFYYVS